MAWILPLGSGDSTVDNLGTAWNQLVEAINGFINFHNGWENNFQYRRDVADHVNSIAPLTPDPIATGDCVNIATNWRTMQYAIQNYVTHTRDYTAFTNGASYTGGNQHNMSYNDGNHNYLLFRQRANEYINASSLSASDKTKCLFTEDASPMISGGVGWSAKWGPPNNRTTDYRPMESGHCIDMVVLNQIWAAVMAMGDCAKYRPIWFEDEFENRSAHSGEIFLADSCADSITDLNADWDANSSYVTYSSNSLTHAHEFTKVDSFYDNFDDKYLFVEQVRQKGNHKFTRLPDGANTKHKSCIWTTTADIPYDGGSGQTINFPVDEFTDFDSTTHGQDTIQAVSESTGSGAETWADVATTTTQTGAVTNKPLDYGMDCTDILTTATWGISHIPVMLSAYTAPEPT